MAHLATVFFDYHLQESDDLVWLLSEAFVNQLGELVRGVREKLKGLTIQ